MMENAINKVHTKSTYVENTEKYLLSKKLPQKEFLELGVSDSFFKESADH